MHTKQTVLKFVVGSAMVLSAVFVPQQSAYAASTCGGVDTSIVGCDDSEDNAIISLLLIIINVMAALVGLAAVGGFIYGAILYTSAGDKSAQVTKAKETLANVVIGLVAFALMWAFLQFLIPGGIFE